MTHSFPQRFPQSARGVTMLEVLIAILIISIGMLGMAGMQAAGLRANVGASQRSAATMLAYDMTDRMRANMAGVNAGDYDLTPINVPTQWANCLQVVGCTALQMAQNDRWEWNKAIQDTLPSGMGMVCQDTSPDDGFGNTDPGQTATGAWCQGGEGSEPTLSKYGGWKTARKPTRTEP